MNVEFRTHQLVFAGLQAQIHLLEQRCVEHRKTIAAKDQAIETVRAVRESDAKYFQATVAAYESRCNTLEADIDDLIAQLDEAKKNARRRPQKANRPA
jgi:prefoldin subunit 5